MGRRMRTRRQLVALPVGPKRPPGAISDTSHTCVCVCVCVCAPPLVRMNGWMAAGCILCQEEEEEERRQRGRETQKQRPETASEGRHPPERNADSSTALGNSFTFMEP